MYPAAPMHPAAPQLAPDAPELGAEWGPRELPSYVPYDQAEPEDQSDPAAHWRDIRGCITPPMVRHDRDALRGSITPPAIPAGQSPAASPSSNAASSDAEDLDSPVKLGGVSAWRGGPAPVAAPAPVPPPARAPPQASRAPYEIKPPSSRGSSRGSAKRPVAARAAKMVGSSGGRPQK